MSRYPLSLLSRFVLCAGLTVAVTGCAFLESLVSEEPADPTQAQAPQLTRRNLSDSVGAGAAVAPTGVVPVNGYLWRAALDTLAFMPVTSADPYGGVILTDWFSPATTPGERFRVNLYILDSTLRADGVRATVFRQTLDSASGQWRDAPVALETAPQLEDSILTRARQLRIQQTGR